LNQTIGYLKKLWETFGINIPKLQNTHTRLKPRKNKLTHINDGHKYTKTHSIMKELNLTLGTFLVATILIYTHNTIPAKI
jgi:hypothetical protein